MRSVTFFLPHQLLKVCFGQVEQNMHFLCMLLASIMMIVDWKGGADKIPLPPICASSNFPAHNIGSAVNHCALQWRPSVPTDLFPIFPLSLSLHSIFHQKTANSCAFFCALEKIKNLSKYYILKYLLIHKVVCARNNGCAQVGSQGKVWINTIIDHWIVRQQLC